MEEINWSDADACSALEAGGQLREEFLLNLLYKDSTNTNTNGSTYVYTYRLRPYGYVHVLNCRLEPDLAPNPSPRLDALPLSSSRASSLASISFQTLRPDSPLKTLTLAPPPPPLRVTHRSAAYLAAPAARRARPCHSALADLGFLPGPSCSLVHCLGRAGAGGWLGEEVVGGDEMRLQRRRGWWEL
jgi:hypothetical protein